MPLRRLADYRGVTDDGYVVVGAPGHPNANAQGYIFEHRLVMTELMGRPLIEGESVHHVNGIRDDNRAKNLELWVVTQPAGQRVEDILEWADEIIGRYRPDPRGLPS